MFTVHIINAAGEDIYIKCSDYFSAETLVNELHKLQTCADIILF